MVITGTFRRSLDDKGRFALPKSMRGVMQKDGVVAGLYMAPGIDGCLAVYTEGSFQELGDRLAQGSPTGPDERAFSRLFYAQAQSVETDGQGRMRIPVELQSLARLGKDVVVVGVRDHIEIWDATRWDAYLGAKQSKYDQIAELAFPRQK